tara:strand:+ start:553 stop:1095 length:543 start_codon:yes stop_codon:yes gene_type:complete
MSELRTNRIVPRDGLPSGASGGIIQTVHNFSNTKIETSVDADIISATITPSTSSSKILFMYTGNVAQESNEGREWGYIAYRDSTAIRLGRDESSNSRATFQAFGTDNVAAGTNHNGTYTITGILVDEPNTTSPVTYKLAIEQFYTTGTTAPVKVGESGWSGTGQEQVTNGYSLTLMEISG